MPNSSSPLIVLSGATGNLGQRVAHYLMQRGASVRALVRAKSSPDSLKKLTDMGATLVEVDFENLEQLTEACQGGSCLVSTLSGLHKVIVEVQTNLLKAAVAAKVPRFIPSDFSIDFTKIPYGTNRNLDLRKEFGEVLAAAPIKATSVLNGMFTDLLIGEAPMVLFPVKRVMYYGSASQPMDFTTIENTAEYTAMAALDANTPRYLHIAGEVASANDMAEVASEATGKKFKPLWLGGTSVLGLMIKVARMFNSAKNEVFPAWQGMQYMKNMFEGKVKMMPLHNNRYPKIKWTPIKEVLAKRSA